jgi:hypothetical protein
MNRWHKRALWAGITLFFYTNTISPTNKNDQLSQAIIAHNVPLVEQLIKQSSLTTQEKRRLKELAITSIALNKKKLSTAHVNTLVGVALSVGSILSLVIATKEELYMFDDGHAKGEEFDNHSFWHYIRHGSTYKSYPPKTSLDKTLKEKNNEKYLSFMHGLFVRAALGTIGLYKLCKGFVQYKDYLNALRIKKLLEQS